VLAHPALTPSTVLMRRSVYDTVGGFDEALVTAEDLDFHIRVAARCRIGLVDEPLARLMRGQQGLSNLRRSYDDALAVVQAAVARGTLPLPQCDVDHALALAWTRAARGKVLSGGWRPAARFAASCWPCCRWRHAAWPAAASTAGNSDPQPESHTHAPDPAATCGP
jgi:hypothetical protein